MKSSDVSKTLKKRLTFVFNLPPRAGPKGDTLKTLNMANCRVL